MDTLTLQPSLFDPLPLPERRIVNVASVKHLSPFRYPGGKTWLVPEVRKWLEEKEERPANFIEIFAGGGIVGLTVAAERLAGHVTLIELDPDVAAVWHTIFNGDAEELAQRITDFDLSPDNVREVLAAPAASMEARAFQTILRNRTFHGGILAHGSGLLKHGENGKGIASRWYAQTLARRIRGLVALRPRITFLEGDGLAYLEKTAWRRDVAYFIDPPYTAAGKSAGKRLYNYSDVDHERLFDLCRSAESDFMMTYDDAASVRSMAEKRGFRIDRVPMKNTHHAQMFELLIFPA